mmetsp:Transcript_15733/g.18193  ORF Transcript_15733/g.18193 Transcript_15733/m.18193 type:complete len:141 (-) Transcript_15733:1359-1781(-)
MYKGLVHYNQQTMDEACYAISQFGADLGGTEIYNALEAIFSNPNSGGLLRQVFLLTDGDVNDPGKVIDLVRANSVNFTLHTFGIGDGVNTDLVTECARAGNGKHYLVGNNCHQLKKKFVESICRSLERKVYIEKKSMTID